jgi:hypothetical protein
MREEEEGGKVWVRKREGVEGEGEGEGKGGVGGWRLPWC